MLLVATLMHLVLNQGLENRRLEVNMNQAKSRGPHEQLVNPHTLATE